MHFTTPLISLLLLGLALTHSAAASPSPSSGEPRQDTTNKFVKRAHHSPHHASPGGGGGGIFGNSGGSMLKTVAGGTALAAGAGFAGTAGGMAAHHLFEGHHEGSSNDDNREKGEEGEKLQVPPRQQSEVAGYPAIRNAPRGGEGVYPVAMLMSDGSYRAIPSDGGQQMVQPPLYASDPVGSGQGRGETGGKDAAGGGSFVFPPDN